MTTTAADRAATLDEAGVLGRLAELAPVISEHTTALEEAYAERLALYRRARELDPPVPFGRVGEAAGVTEVAVIQAIRKSDAKLAAAETKPAKAKKR